MILLNSATYSTITLTLTEKSTGATNSFVIEFTNEQSKEVIRATASNISIWTARYDRFILDLGVLKEGYYSYSAWENGVPATILETGKALCPITSTGLGTTYSTTYNINPDRIVYQNK